METRVLTPYLILIVALLGTSIALAFTVDTAVSDEAGIRLELPPTVNAWAGDELRYCQNPTCLERYVSSELVDPDTCPACANPLHSMTFAERQLLPLDTTLFKKRYTNGSGKAIFATVVLSGKERGSIHRPEVCLVGQGRSIVGRSVLTVPFEDRKPLKVSVLDLLYEQRLRGGKPGPEIQSYYAYWFVGKDRETPYHLERIIWMGLDRVMRNVAHRWAYIGIGGGRKPGTQAYRDEIRSFVQGLYPQMALY